MRKRRSMSPSSEPTFSESVGSLLSRFPLRRAKQDKTLPLPGAAAVEPSGAGHNSRPVEQPVSHPVNPDIARDQGR